MFSTIQLITSQSLVIKEERVVTAPRELALCIAWSAKWCCNYNDKNRFCQFHHWLYMFRKNILKTKKIFFKSFTFCLFSLLRKWYFSTRYRAMLQRCNKLKNSWKFMCFSFMASYKVIRYKIRIFATLEWYVPRKGLTISGNVFQRTFNVNSDRKLISNNSQ